MTCDPQGPAMSDEALKAAGPWRSLWQRLRALDAWLNDCWVGDLLGVILIFLILAATPVALPILVIICGGNP